MTFIHLLSDQDQVLNDWNSHFVYHMDEMYPQFSHLIPRPDEMRSFDLWTGQPQDVQDAITNVFNYEGFYEDIPVLPGAVDALHEMSAKGYMVSIVTSPWWYNPTCLEDKKNWVTHHLGEEWTRRLIFTTDKTKIRGDVLIDDKPEIEGLYEGNEEWVQILFDTPYNRHVTDKPRMYSWDGWEDVVGEVMDVKGMRSLV